MAKIKLKKKNTPKVDPFNEILENNLKRHKDIPVNPHEWISLNKAKPHDSKDIILIYNNDGSLEVMPSFVALQHIIMDASYHKLKSPFKYWMMIKPPKESNKCSSKRLRLKTSQSIKNR